MSKKPNDPEAAAANDIERIGFVLWGPSWQSAMAEAIGVSRDTISDWKFGRMTPRPGVYVDILRAAEGREREFAAVLALLRTRVAQGGLRALARRTEINRAEESDQ